MKTGELLEQVGDGIDAVACVDMDALPVSGLGSVIEDVVRLQRQLDLVTHGLIRRFDALGGPQICEYRTAKQWLRDRLGVDGGTAHRTVRLGRDLESMPTVEQRWADGDLDADRARVVAAARTPETEEQFAEWEPWLAERAAELDSTRLKKVVATWKLRVTPDSDDVDRPFRERKAHVSETFGRTVVIDAVLDAIGGGIFKTEFDRLVEQLFRDDWTAATDRLGRQPTVEELDRTHDQRRADALVEMAVRSLRLEEKAAFRPRPLITIVTTAYQLARGMTCAGTAGGTALDGDAPMNGNTTLDGGTAQLWSGTPITDRELARLLAMDPHVEQFFYDDNGVPIRYNPRRRLYGGKLRRAIEARDRSCTGSGCDAPIERCQVDHIVPWADGGQTTPDNGRLACGPCNRARPNQRFDRPRPVDGAVGGSRDRDRPSRSSATGGTDPP